MAKLIKRYRFFYHYFRFGEKKMSVHFKGTCYNVDNVQCHVPCETKWNKRQPRLVMQGFASDLSLDLCKGQLIATIHDQSFYGN